MSQRGTITKWLADKGYGFVRTDGSTQDIFLHHSVIAGGARPAGGEEVSFDINLDPQTHKPRAIHVTVHGHEYYDEGYYGGRYYDGHSRSAAHDEEQILIDFGVLLGDDNEEAKKIHEQYQADNDMGKFVAAAQTLLASSGKSKGRQSKEEKPRPPSKGIKKEEQLLIDFGLKLQEGDEEAKKIHEEYTKDSDYEKFLASAGKLVA